MLKKLVKYGNSCALLLDRTLLDLLNIKKNSILKLREEGDALIVKVQDEVKPTESLLLQVETIQEQCSVGKRRGFFYFEYERGSNSEVLQRGRR